jgi:hypothetical protein
MRINKHHEIILEVLIGPITRSNARRDYIGFQWAISRYPGEVLLQDFNKG